MGAVRLGDGTPVPEAIMIVVELSAFALEMLGPEPQKAVEALVEAEALRLYHIRRSQPKAERKPESALGDQLLLMFDRRRRMTRDPLPKALVEAEEAVMDAIDRGDEVELERMWAEQVWVLKK